MYLTGTFSRKVKEQTLVVIDKNGKTGKQISITLNATAGSANPDYNPRPHRPPLN